MCNAPPSKKRKRNHNVKKEEDDNNIELKMSSIILRSASPFFHRILSKYTVDVRIIVHAKTVKDVEDLLYFMTTDELKADYNASNVIHLALRYQMNKSTWICINRLIKDLTVENLAETISIFDKHNISDGYQTLIDFAKEHLDKLVYEPTFLQLPHSFRHGILGVRSKCLK